MNDREKWREMVRDIVLVARHDDDDDDDDDINQAASRGCQC